jgi:hypothetical protein
MIAAVNLDVWLAKALGPRCRFLVNATPKANADL